MKILNYTQHPIVIFSKSGNPIQLPRHGTARCSITRKIVSTINIAGEQIIVNETRFGDAGGLPEERDDTIIIVSNITANVLRKFRKDIYTVDEPVRDERGIIVGCRSLSMDSIF